jgi:DNA-binding IclR family transcriptional regulator
MSAGFLVRDPVHRRFFISPSAVELFRHANGGMIHQLVDCAEEPMQALFAQLNENVLLALQKDQRVFFIKHISSSHLMSIRIEPEPDYPMHVTAAGRAILAFLPEKEINAYIRKASFEKITSKTVASEEALREVLQETREKGFAFNPGEFEEGVMAAAAPILLHDRPVASLVVQFPRLRHSESEALASGQLIRHATQKIEKRIHSMVQG